MLTIREVSVIKQVSFRVSDETMLALKVKTLQDGTSIQTVFSAYAEQYLNDNNTVFVKPEVALEKREVVERLIEDSESLAKRLKDVAEGIDWVESFESAVDSHDESPGEKK